MSYRYPKDILLEDRCIRCGGRLLYTRLPSLFGDEERKSLWCERCKKGQSRIVKKEDEGKWRNGGRKKLVRDYNDWMRGM